MMQRHRISTEIGKDHKVTVELKQEYDLLEVLSLQFTQKDIYTTLCSDYGVVCGRISINNGLGVPNAKVSIFVPITDEDFEDPVISKLYPYKLPTDKNEDNVRYNLLPNKKQHSGHEPTGTFPDQSDILTREEMLEVYEKYYSFTVKTNESGDFMIWGVPIGSQTLHIDVDMSDIGCFSLRPYDFIRKGTGSANFKNLYSFKSSNDIDALPQIFSFDKTIEVYPFWGNKDLCEIGITRSDFDLSSQGIEITPVAYIIGGTFTDSGKNSINKNCQVRKKMGRKCDLTTRSGKIEFIRFTNEKDEDNRPILEFYETNEDIDDDGSFLIPLPMNMEYLYTNEFGENVISNDSTRGVATSSCYRLRMSINDSGLSRVRANGDYLLPNIREYTNDVDKSYSFSTNLDDYPETAIDNLILNKVGSQYHPKDYFYRFTYNKVYTVSSFQGSYFKGGFFNKGEFLGIKELSPSEEEDCNSDVLTPPVNFGVRNFTFTLLIAEVLLFFEHLINLIVFTFFNTLTRIFHSLANAVDFWPIRRLSDIIRKFAYQLQESGQRKLYLISYPDCEECSDENNSFGDFYGGNALSFCEVGTLVINGSSDENNRTLSVPLSGITFYTSQQSGCTSARLITSISDFISNQSRYAITYGDDIGLSLSGTPFSQFLSVITFDDSDGLFNETIQYVVTIRDTQVSRNNPNFTTEVESGCELYDVPYDEDIVEEYYSGVTTSNGLVVNRTTITKGQYRPGMDIVATKLGNSSSSYYIPQSFNGYVFDRITPSGYTEFSNGIFLMVPGTQTNRRVFEILREYRRRKRVNKMFCGGIVNFSFIDNWLSGSLYFFQFKAKSRNKNNELKVKYCREVVRYIKEDDKFYYRSSPYNPTNNTWGQPSNDGSLLIRRLHHPTTFIDLGPRDEFINEICFDTSLDPNCSISRSIGSTSFQSFGDILATAINYRMDVSDNTFDLNKFFDNRGFDTVGAKRVLDGDILQLISINSEAGIEEFDLQNFKYIGYSYQFLDPELYPSVFRDQNRQWGPLPITLQLDEDGERVRACINAKGRLDSSAQEVPFYLWDKKGLGFGQYGDGSDDQSWDYTDYGIEVQPLQGMTYGYTLVDTPNNPSDQYLLLPMTYNFSGLTILSDNPISGITVDFDVMDDSGIDNHELYDNKYPGFTYLYITDGTEEDPRSGILYVRYGSAGTWSVQNWSLSTSYMINRTQDYYITQWQILSTPFLYYFGLRPGKTGLDKFINYFGPKGAFNQ
jgi:hypothetical protein